MLVLDSAQKIELRSNNAFVVQLNQMEGEGEEGLPVGGRVFGLCRYCFEMPFLTATLGNTLFVLRLGNGYLILLHLQGYIR